MTAEDFAKNGRFKEAVAALVRETGGGTSFVEIVNFLEPYMPVDGDQELTWPEYPMIILWQEMSSELVRLIQDLLNGHILMCRPTEWLVYLADRKMLLLPLATELTEYQEPHWLPVVFELATTPYTELGQGFWL